MFELISTDNFESGLLDEKRPVLLACIRRDHEFKEQTEVLERVSKSYGEDLKVCLLDGDFTGACRRLGIEGTPTFLILYEGKEKARMLGKADMETLNSFVLRALPYSQKENGHDERT